MKCVLCFMIHNGAVSLEIPHEMSDAVTIVHGMASCEDHFIDLQSGHTPLSHAFQTAWHAFMYESGLAQDPRMPNPYPVRTTR